MLAGDQVHMMQVLESSVKINNFRELPLGSWVDKQEECMVADLCCTVSE